jgi:hypothetical protein
MMDRQRDQGKLFYESRLDYRIPQNHLFCAESTVVAAGFVKPPSVRPITNTDTITIIGSNTAGTSDRTCRNRRRGRMVSHVGTVSDGQRNRDLRPGNSPAPFLAACPLKMLIPESRPGDFLVRKRPKSAKKRLCHSELPTAARKEPGFRWELRHAGGEKTTLQNQHVSWLRCRDSNCGSHLGGLSCREER